MNYRYIFVSIKIICVAQLLVLHIDNALAMYKAGLRFLGARRAEQIHRDEGLREVSSEELQQEEQVSLEAMAPEAYKQLLEQPECKVLNGHASKVLNGYASEVNCLAYCPTEDQLACGSADGSVRLWNPKTGYQSKFLRVNTGVVCIAYSPSGNQLVAGVGDEFLGFINPKTVDQLQVIQVHDAQVRRLAYSPNGEQLALGCADGVRLLNSKSGEQLNFLPVGYVYLLAYNPKGEQLALAIKPSYESDLADSVLCWNTKTERQLIIPCRISVMCLAYSRNGDQLAVGCYRPGRLAPIVRLCDPNTGVELKVLEMYSGFVTCLAYNPKGDQLAAGSDVGKIHFCNPKTGDIFKVLQGHTSNLKDLAYSPSGEQLATLSHDGTVRLWSFGNERFVRACNGLPSEQVKLIVELCREISQKKINQRLVGEQERIFSSLPEPIRNRLCVRFDIDEKKLK